MCLRNWSEHNREYYECSIYKQNPQIANETSGVKAREALKKYLFYYERVCPVFLLIFYPLLPLFQSIPMLHLQSIISSCIFIYLKTRLTSLRARPDINLIGYTSNTNVKTSHRVTACQQVVFALLVRCC